MTPYPPWIFAYLAHYLGSAAAAKCKPTGRVRRCPRTGPGACGRLGYWFRDETIPTFTGRDGKSMERMLVVWDGKTPAAKSAIEYGMVNPDLPYGIDLGVYRDDAAGYFSCGWCGHPEMRPGPAKPVATLPPPRTVEPAAADEARRAEIEAWADKLEKANPAMAAKVRLLADLPTPRSGGKAR